MTFDPAAYIEGLEAGKLPYEKPTIRRMVPADLVADPEVVPGPTKEKKRRPLAGGAIELKDAEPAADQVDGSMLLHDITATIQRFVVLPEGGAEALALWVAHSYLLDAFDVSPILALGSPTKRCGKTSTLRVLAGLVRWPLPASSISAATIYRVVEQRCPTLVIDEMDAARENEDLRAVLNSGHSRDLAFIIRCVGEGANLEPRRFSTWCPKVLAFIGRLPGTLEDRSIIISMRRKLPGERRERIRRRQLEALLEPVRARLARWTADAFDAVAELHPGIPEELDDRAADNWEPLLAIADAAGGHWPTLARRIALALSCERAEDEATDNPGLLVLADIKGLLDTEDLDVEDGVSAESACEALRKLTDRPWGSWGRGRDGLLPVHLARLLRPFGLKAKPGRHGQHVVRRYRLDALREAMDRYLSSGSSRPATPATSPDPQRVSPDDSMPVAGVAGLQGCSGSEPMVDSEEIIE